MVHKAVFTMWEPCCDVRRHKARGLRAQRPRHSKRAQLRAHQEVPMARRLAEMPSNHITIVDNLITGRADNVPNTPFDND